MKIPTRTKLLFIAPILVFMACIVVYPVVDILWCSLSDVKLANPFHRPFVGLANFKAFFSDKVALHSLSYSFLFIVTTVTSQLLLGSCFALLLESKLIKGASVYQTIITIPLAIAPVITALFWRILLHNQLGLLNYFLDLLGMEPIMWWGNLSLTPFTLMIIDTWQWTPFTMLIVLGGLRAIPGELIEAAEVDGASSWQVFRYIKLPLLSKFMLIAAILRIPLAQKKVFDLVAATTGGGPGRATETLNFRIYKTLFANFDLGYTGALSVILLLLMVLSLQPFARRLWK
jgi:multiple sugar transport system permease protein